MFDKRLLLVITCAVTFGLFAALLVSRYLSNVRAQSRSIVAASASIPMSTQITSDQLTVIYLPSDSIPEGAFTSIEKVIGRVTVTGIGVREPVTELKLAAEGSAAGLAAMIAGGSRAMTVKVDDVVGVAGFVLPGAWVDIVAVIDPSEQGESQGPTSKIVLQHIRVLASDRNIEKQETGETTMTVKAVTLEVTPEQAEKLALAATEGKLQLVMRNSVDDDTVQTPGVDKRGLLAGGSGGILAGLAASASAATASVLPRVARPRSVTRDQIPDVKVIEVEKPKPVAPRVRIIEIIEGGKRRTIEFPQGG